MLTAVPKPGYRFVGWKASQTTIDQPRLEAKLSSAAPEFAARFEPLDPSYRPTPGVIVTELQYHPASDQESGDWVEFHNPGDTPVRMAGWIFRDGNNDHDFLVPELTVPPKGHVVLCQDSAKFGGAYPNVKNSAGDFVFGLNNSGDAIRLFDQTGLLLFSMEYDDKEPWPREADGTGRTLQLTESKSDPANPKAWSFSPNLGGTPGRPNL